MTWRLLSATVPVMSALLAPGSAVLPPGFEDRLLCDAGFCQRAKPNAKSYGPTSSYVECYDVITAQVAPVLAWGSQSSSDQDLQTLLDAGWHGQTCEQQQEQQQQQQQQEAQQGLAAPAWRVDPTTWLLGTVADSGFGLGFAPGAIISAGGTDGDSSTDVAASIQPFADGNAADWHSLPPLPTARCCGLTVAANADVVVVMGGRASLDSRGGLRSASLLDLSTVDLSVDSYADGHRHHQWVSIPAMNFARRHMAACALPSTLGGGFLTLGGLDDSGRAVQTVERLKLGDVQNGADCAFTSATHMPTKRSHLAAIAVADQAAVYAVGGVMTEGRQKLQVISGAVERYWPETGKWQQLQRLE